MFMAAAAVGPATQPLLLFYGLSQAGRAIAAAARAATGDTWRLIGHGVKASHLDHQLTEVTAVAEKTGSFVRLAELVWTAQMDQRSLGRATGTVAHLR
jgi:hypothetical protein